MHTSTLRHLAVGSALSLVAGLAYAHVPVRDAAREAAGAGQRSPQVAGRAGPGALSDSAQRSRFALGRYLAAPFHDRIRKRPMS